MNDTIENDLKEAMNQTGPEIIVMKTTIIALQDRISTLERELYVAERWIAEFESTHP